MLLALPCIAMYVGNSFQEYNVLCPSQMHSDAALHQSCCIYATLLPRNHASHVVHAQLTIKYCYQYDAPAAHSVMTFSRLTMHSKSLTCVSVLS